MSNNGPAVDSFLSIEAGDLRCSCGQTDFAVNVDATGKLSWVICRDCRADYSFEVVEREANGMSEKMRASFDNKLRSGDCCAQLREGQSNKRERSCRRCGTDIPKGAGTLIKYSAYGMHEETYLCAPCVPAVKAIVNGDAEQGSAA